MPTPGSSLPSPVAPAPRPHSRSLLRAVMALSLLLGVVLTVLSPVAAVRAEPGPGDDFPQLPSHCQSVYQQVPLRPCHITRYGPKRPMVVVWGDSHAWMYQAALTRAAERRRVNLVMVVAGGCAPAIPPVRKNGKPATLCETRDQAILDWVTELSGKRSDLKLILGGFWAGYRLGWHRMHVPGHPRKMEFPPYKRHLIQLAHFGIGPLFRRLGQLGIDVDVIGQAGTVPPHPPACAAGTLPYQCNLPRRLSLHDETDTTRYLHGLMSHLSTRNGTPRLIDPSPAYCGPRTCYAHVDGHNTWYDSIHLGLSFTRTLARYFLPSFRDLG